MSADLQALLASPWWKWKPGMAGLDPDGHRWRASLGCGGILLWEAEGDVRGYTTLGAASVGLRPDVADPATIGCLLAIMYAAEAQHITPSPVSVCLSQYGLTGSRTVDAIISAILAAPPPGASDVG